VDYDAAEDDPESRKAGGHPAWEFGTSLSPKGRQFLTSAAGMVSHGMLLLLERFNN
jgi:hypothetical protein